MQFTERMRAFMSYLSPEETTLRQQHSVRVFRAMLAAELRQYQAQQGWRTTQHLHVRQHAGRWRALRSDGAQNHPVRRRRPLSACLVAALPARSLAR